MTISPMTVLRSAQVKVAELHLSASDKDAHQVLAEVERCLNDGAIVLWSAGRDLTDPTADGGAQNRGYEWTVQELVDFASQHLYHAGRLLRLIAVGLDVKAAEGADELVGAPDNVSDATDPSLDQRLLKMADEYQQVAERLLVEVS